MPRKRETLSEYIKQCSESNPVPRESLNDERRSISAVKKII